VILYQEKDRYVIEQEKTAEIAKSIAEVPRGGTAVIISHDLDKNYVVLFRNIIVLASKFKEEDAKQLLKLMSMGQEVKLGIMDIFFKKPKAMGNFKVLELDLAKVLRLMRKSIQVEIDALYSSYMLEFER
jgi:1-aminocyclopropane-1-carboxylate deaminase/D-cysteine desulfhydrase-like pyridoxal-dependent ACC family enzyme